MRSVQSNEKEHILFCVYDLDDVIAGFAVAVGNVVVLSETENHVAVY